MKLLVPALFYASKAVISGCQYSMLDAALVRYVVGNERYVPHAHRVLDLASIDYRPEKEIKRKAGRQFLMGTYTLSKGQAIGK